MLPLGFAFIAASSLAGGALNARAGNEKRAKIAREMRENAAEGMRIKNMDPSQSLYSQYYLRKTFEDIRRRNDEAAGTDAVMGTRTLGEVQPGNAEQLSDTAARLAIGEAQRQDQLVAQNERRGDALKEMDLAEDEKKRQSIANAMANGVNAAGSMMG